jgi:hypothetical protein
LRRYKEKWVVNVIFPECPKGEIMTTNILAGRCRRGRIARATIYVSEDSDGFPDLTAARVICR